MNIDYEELNEARLREMFAKSDDVIIVSRLFGPPCKEHKIVLLYCVGMAQTEKIDQVVIPNLRTMLENSDVITPETLGVNATLLLEQISGEDWLELFMLSLYSGELILWFESSNLLYRVNIAQPPNRSPEESSTEISIKGPRDSFTESMITNVALVRKRMKSHSLCSEQFIVGKRSRTAISMLYVGDVADPRIVEQVRQGLHSIDIDGVIGSGQLEGSLAGSRFRLFPVVESVGRPDYVFDCLLQGRVSLIVDGSPMALIVPANLTLILKSPEDIYFPGYYVFVERIVRTVGLIVAMFFPGFYIAVTAFNFDQIPFPLLATFASVRQGLPLSGPMDFFIMLALFELFREAGLRLPKPVGQTVAVVGGLIVGDAAIRAGITGPATLVAVAISTISMFTVVNQSLTGSVTLLRILILIVSSLFGIYGFMISVIALVLYLSTLQTFGIPYLAPLSPLSLRDLLAGIVPKSYKIDKYRPAFLKTLDKTKKSKGKR